MRTIEPKIPEISLGISSGIEILVRKFSKVWVVFARLLSFPDHFCNFSSIAGFQPFNRF